ncbi:hypothetical protein QBC34DRAFT_139425 [Podospora aff. communis PSN243]|uniref:SMP domain-containing protein n=1 Tax=Podospora aff. communis PSN243 TaxID=3040156 RepID=A0AAV9H0V7_9PEZI|nr:hypothetical protein QBC34DRAFT_139425 [Podospora aff. communis PSN243]
MSANPNSVTGQGEFHDSIKPSKPMTTKGHRIGQPIGNEAVPEFHAQTYPPGTAPKDHTFYPNPISEIPGQALNPNMDPSLRTGGLDIPGATSQSVYNQSAYARPMEGQTSSELRDNRTGRHGLERVGASTEPMVAEDTVRRKGQDIPSELERAVKAKMAEGEYKSHQEVSSSAGKIASERP